MKVFISYTQSDEKLARKVAASLEQAGLDVWDDREILPGDNWADKIAQALRESDAMVVLLTPEALRSSWVSRDIEYALGEKGYSKRLIPVLVGPPKKISKENIPWILRHLQLIMLAEPDKEEEGIRQIAQALLDAAENQAS
ncbi:MAG: toll/interleukin-1 receptor domain-containing protein [bacterium]